MSSARASEKVVKNLMKAKGVSKDVIRNMNRAESQASRLLSSVSQLARGDVSGLIAYLAGMGPLGLKLAVILGLGAIGYGIYEQATKEKPTELYFWRYPE